MPRRRLASLLLGLAAGCGDDAPIPQVDNATLLVSQHLGSGVYVGDGHVLTNWHVCALPLFDESLDDTRDHLRYFHAPGDGGAPLVEGLAPDSYYCPVSGATPEDLDYTVSATDTGGCARVVDLEAKRLAFTRIGVEAPAGRMRFADWTIDTCLLEVDADTRAQLDGTLEPLTLDLDPVTVGQEVVVAGHNTDGINQVGVDACRVIAAPALIVDPDPIAPSPLEVPSFAIDCRRLEHGSSGSPVFDAATGRLLGLVWTGVDLGTAEVRVYVTAISEWRARLAPRPVAQFAQLDALLTARGQH